LGFFSFFGGRGGGACRLPLPHVQEVEKEVDSRLDPCQLQDSCCTLPLQLVNAVVNCHVQAWRLLSVVVDRQL
jgi:hypothetical protein